MVRGARRGARRFDPALDATTGAVAELWTPEWQLGFVEGAPDGRRAAVIEGVGSDRYFVAGALVILDAAGGAVTVDTPGVDVSSARWLDGERLLALGVSGMETVGLAIDLRTGRSARPSGRGRPVPTWSRWSRPRGPAATS